MVSSKCRGTLSAVASDMSVCVDPNSLFADLDGHRVNITHRRNVVLEHNKQSECKQAHVHVTHVDTDLPRQCNVRGHER